MAVNGYGRFGIGRVVRYAHRVAWELEHGPPGKRHVLHGCDNPSCVRLSHLHLGTHNDNMREMSERGRRTNKLTPAKVRRIRGMPSAPARVLAARFGVSKVMINYIRARVWWKYA
jgi:hypothetical protein